jgi:diaminohydroxyphosphoribosylaminopyrimidine deaminase/5-amino-6-(5-phosphoribosylamino)uracil reductase
MISEDAQRMRAALALARRGLGVTWPNPSVGCVIGREGRVLGRGWTQPGGRPHAEQMALAQARERWGAEALRGATAWVSLEPCAHHGRTPPCADALAAAGLSRVVAPMADPDPRVNGRGFGALREAGLQVEVGLMEAEARALNAGFFSRLERGIPLVTLKLAASLDGRIATAAGESRWITGSAARARVHLMRARSDAVMVGAGTARADDPALDVRLPGLSRPTQVRVVVDPRLSLPLEGRLARSAGVAPLWLLHGPDAPPERAAALAAAGATLIEAPATAGGVDLGAAMRALAARGLTRVLCEGGGGLAASLLRGGLIGEIAWFAAGAALGADGLPAVGPLDLARLADAPRFAVAAVETLGGDVLTLWRRAAP